ncbi:helix-turn-helix transcriptional regulator [Pseudomonas aeruginosa]|uniref:helix-turn-helix transcriptional regulator n=1 Tax=Pseudomonas aeruginosa TaxID=287 RepID=UPI0038C6DCFA|nr:AlpA family transcriptional regulator [Pseudomonas aeruginosa]
MRVLRLGDVISLTGLARSTIYKSIGEGEFPRPINLIGRSVGWIEAEVHDWIRARVAERESPTVKS